MAAKMPALSVYLGHSDPANTYWYVSADMTLKDAAIARITPPGIGAAHRFKPSDSLLEFLTSL